MLAQLEGMTHLLLCCVAVLPLAAGITAQERTAPTTITAHVVKPEKLAVDDRRVKVTVPPGFEVAKFAEGLGKPRILAVADDRTVYVTRRESGDMLMLRDADDDGKAEPPVTVARRPQIHGIAIDGSRVYLVTVKELFVANRNDDGTLGKQRAAS